MKYAFLFKPLILLSLFAIYSLYVNLFGVIAFFSPSLFLTISAEIILFVWGLAIAFSLRSVPEKQLKIKKFFIGIFFSILTLVISNVAHDLNVAGITWKFRKYDKQLTQMCEDMLNTGHADFPLSDYKQFDIWPPGAKPTRQQAIRKGGVIMLDFIGSPDNLSGVAYNPKHEDLGIEFKYMFGPWYYFDIWDD